MVANNIDLFPIPEDHKTNERIVVLFHSSGDKVYMLTQDKSIVQITQKDYDTVLVPCTFYSMADAAMALYEFLSVYPLRKGLQIHTESVVIMKYSVFVIGGIDAIRRAP